MQPVSLRRAATALILVASAAALPACVERKMFIRSDPPGAAITLDGERLDVVTPAEIPFDFGGTRGVSLTAPGRKVLDATAELKDPWFTYFPLDVAAEFLWPGTIRDVQTFDFKMEPYAAWSPEVGADAKTRLSALKLRAAEYRAGGAEGPGKVAPSAPPPPPPPPPGDTPKK